MGRTCFEPSSPKPSRKPMRRIRHGFSIILAQDAWSQFFPQFHSNPFSLDCFLVSPSCRILVFSYSRFVVLSSCRLVVLSSRRLIVSSSCCLVVLLCCHLVVLSSSRLVVLSSLRVVVLSFVICSSSRQMEEYVAVHIVSANQNKCMPLNINPPIRCGTHCVRNHKEETNFRCAF